MEYDENMRNVKPERHDHHTNRVERPSSICDINNPGYFSNKNALDLKRKSEGQLKYSYRSSRKNWASPKIAPSIDHVMDSKRSISLTKVCSYLKSQADELISLIKQESSFLHLYNAKEVRLYSLIYLETLGR